MKRPGQPDPDGPNYRPLIDPWSDDHTDRIDPLIAGQWLAALVFCATVIGLLAWAISAAINLITA
jgi:hypothetical protein